jgi:dolichyl-phosphate-mannose--protein O-mannosyl transferase
VFEFRDASIRIGLLLGIPIVFYVLNYYFFFGQLYKHGFGSEFMLPDFQSTLEGSPKEGKFPAPSFWENFVYLQFEVIQMIVCGVVKSITDWIGLDVILGC